MAIAVVTGLVAQVIATTLAVVVGAVEVAAVAAVVIFVIMDPTVALHSFFPMEYALLKM